MPFEGHYGVMNNYAVGSLETKKSKGEKGLDANAASSSTIGYSEFSLFKTALNYLNANQKLAKAKNFLNSFRGIKEPSNEDLNKSKSSSLDIEKQITESDDVNVIVRTAKGLTSMNFKESPIRTINVSISNQVFKRVQEQLDI